FDKRAARAALLRMRQILDGIKKNSSPRGAPEGRVSKGAGCRTHEFFTRPFAGATTEWFALPLLLLVNRRGGLGAHIAVAHIIAHRVLRARLGRAVAGAAAALEADDVAGLQGARLDRAQFLAVGA